MIEGYITFKYMVSKKSRNNKFVDIRPRHTRAAVAPLLKYSHIVLTSYEHSLEVSTAQVWNTLLPRQRNIQEISVFKREMRSVLQDKIDAYNN